MGALLATTLTLLATLAPAPAPVTVAVLDTGVDVQHPELAPRLVERHDFIGTRAPTQHPQPDDDPDDPLDGSGHGTLVTGVLARSAPNARFLALRTCWDEDQCYQSVQAPAIDWAARRGARVVSMSWLSGPLEPELRAAIVRHPEVLFVGIPSGNGTPYDADDEDPEPCNLDAPNVLCVSTPECGAYGRRSVDVAVPTRGLVTTRNGGGTTTTACATSYAAPAAAGVAAVLFGQYPGATASEVRRAIIAGARPDPAWRRRSVSGGVLDAERAATAIARGPRASRSATATGPRPSASR